MNTRKINLPHLKNNLTPNNQNIMIDRIAAKYLSAAQIQQVSAIKICNYLNQIIDIFQNRVFSKNTMNDDNTKHHVSPPIILDLGSGPGTLSHLQNLADDNEYVSNSFSSLCSQEPAQLILCDLNLKILKHTPQQYLEQRNRNAYMELKNSALKNIKPNVSSKMLKINADGHSLPFADSSIDIIISNLMIQWSTNKPQILHEVRRVLKPNGIFIYATLVEHSIWQLQHTWITALGKDMGNRRTLTFESLNYYINLSTQNQYIQNNLHLVNYESWEHIIYFTDIYNLMRHFKNTGTNLSRSKQSGLGGKQQLQKFEQIYETMRTPHGLPLSYVYGLFVLEKTSKYPKDAS